MDNILAILLIVLVFIYGSIFITFLCNPRSNAGVMMVTHIVFLLLTFTYENIVQLLFIFLKEAPGNVNNNQLLLNEAETANIIWVFWLILAILIGTIIYLKRERGPLLKEEVVADEPLNRRAR